MNAPDAATKSRAAHLGPERRRPLVLDAAQQIAVDDGLGAVNIASVAVRLGVTRPVVYACFADRVSLVDALLEREAALLLGATINALHSADGDDPQTVFTDGYRALLGAVQQRPGSWKVVFGGTPDPAIASVIADGRKMVYDASAHWLAPAIRRWWDPEDLDRKLPALIELFMSSCESAVRLLVDDANDLTTDDLAELYARMMIAAYRVA